MSNITDIKSVLTQKGLDTFCHKYHIPNDVHPQLPSPNQTIHKIPTGKIGVYTIFFEYAKFRLPLSNFLVNVLRHYRINLSQLSVITATKVSYFEILCCVHSIEPTVWYKDPTKVKVGEKERTKGEAKLLDSTVGRVVPLLPVSPAHAESELEASVDRLFDEGGSADQGDSAAGGGQDAETELVMRVKIINAENVIAERPRRPRKKWQAVTDASGSSHPPKKLKGDHRSFSGPATSGKSPSVLKKLLASSILNVESGVEAVATLPLVTSFVSAMPERESGAPTNSITGLNLRSIGPFESFVISSDSSHHFSTNTTEAGIDSFIRSVAPPSVMTKVVITTNIASIPSVPALETGTKVISPVHAAMFHDSDSTGTVRPDAASSSHNVSNDTLLDDHDASWEFIKHLAPLYYLLKSVRWIITICLRRKRLESECEKQADLLKARDAEVESLKAQLLLKETKDVEVAHLRAQNSVDGKVTKLQSLISAKDLELKDLNVVVYSLKSQNDGLVDQVHALETTCSSLRDQVSGYERLKEQIEEFQDAHMRIVNDKVAKLDADLLETALHLEEKFYPHLLNTIYAGGSAISRTIKKGMQDGLSADIDHEKADQVVLGETSLSLAISVAHSRVERIRENVAVQRVPTAIVSKTTLSITFAFASSVRPITMDDYEIVNVDGQEDSQGNGQGNVASFPIVEFEKEELDTTPERDLPS
ncbi:hypothetical protein Tco_1136690 [Tanacetum coccineum]